MVGSAVALALGKCKALSDRSIVVLEEAPAKQFSHPTDYCTRVSALNNSSKSLLESLGVWATVEDFRVKPVKGFHVWDRTGGLLSVNAEDSDGADNLFFIVENDLLVHAFGERLRECTNVQVEYETSVESLSQDEEDLLSIKTKGKTNAELRTKFVIGADGFESTVRKTMKDHNQYLSRSYEQCAVVALLKLADRTPNDMAWQKFLPSGPIALLPLSEDMSSLVWTLPNERARAIVKLSAQDLVQELNQALGRKPAVSDPLPRIESASQIAAFPLGVGHSVRYVQTPGIALVGDAAHRVHPMGGQGVNLGFGDVACLVRCLSSAARLGETFPSTPAMLAYESERQRHNVPMLLGVDLLQKLYGIENEVVTTLRTLGVTTVNNWPALKKTVASFAA